MLNDDETWKAELSGRILALEWLATDEIIDTYSRVPSGDLVGGIQANRDIKFASLQHLERPVDEFHDRVWEVAIEALERMYGNAIVRAAGLMEPL